MICPKCHEELVRKDGSFRCPNNHTFDISRHGSVNLSMKSKAGGDNREMVKARTAFLEKDYYLFLKQELKKILDSLHVSSYLDIGCGQGYYTRTLGQDIPDSYGVDLSKEAIAYAARKDRHTQYVVASIYTLPFADSSFQAVTSIFTPIPKEELNRIVAPDGYFIAVSPAADHLLELKEQIYDQVYKNEEKSPDIPGFHLQESRVITDQKLVDEVWNLFEMTPYRYKTSSAGLSKVQALKELKITFSFLISIYRKESV